MKKIFIINGSGGVGKDTFVELLGKYAKTMHASIVTNVKRMARVAGWGLTKTEKDRKFLSDLKLLVDEYNDSNYQYIANLTNVFLEDEGDDSYQIFCVDMREKNQIDRYVEEFGAKKVLVTRSSVEHITSNMADAGVFETEYDYTIKNDGTIEELDDVAKKFAEMLKEA